VSDWQALGSPIPAQRRDVSDVERLAAGFVGTAAQSRFVIRDTAFARSILHTDCLQHEGIVWEIIGIKEVPPGRGFIEITASTGNRP
jgi:head-tail adaptor